MWWINHHQVQPFFFFFEVTPVLNILIIKYSLKAIIFFNLSQCDKSYTVKKHYQPTFILNDFLSLVRMTQRENWGWPKKYLFVDVVVMWWIIHRWKALSTYRYKRNMMFWCHTRSFSYETVTNKTTKKSSIA